MTNLSRMFARGCARVSACAAAALLLFSLCAPFVCAASLPFSLPFKDVPEDAWYYHDVFAAYESGFVNGRTADTFEPGANLTLAEVIKLAACVHQRAAEGSVTLTNAPDTWYLSYVAYALEHEMLPAEARWTDADFRRDATRGETMAVFANAVPLESVNEIPDGSIPDVHLETDYGDAVYALYRAGVAQGDAEHRAHPDETIIRAEIAAIVGRLAFPENRLSFTMVPEELREPEDFREPDELQEPEEKADAESETPKESETSSEGETPAESGTLYAPPRDWSERTLHWAALYDARFGEGASDEILLTGDEIAAYNARMIADCPVMTDIAAFPDSLTGETVRALIGAYVLPTGYDYDKNGAWIETDTRNAILANRALDKVPGSVPVRRAVIVSRSDLRGQPTDEGFYAWGDKFYDMIQETELVVGTPVAILHESADGKWLFAQAYHYAGWIPAETAAFCSSDDFARYASPEEYVTVTAVRIPSGETVLDMGVTLPCGGEIGENYKVSVPVRQADGTLAERIVTISKGDCVLGSLPYTMKNFYEEAFAYLGTPYGWGGADGGVDCSGFVTSVMRTFGIRLPRNTAEQRVFSGKTTDIVYTSAADRLALFAGSRFPVAIHRQRHVMFYLGEENGALYIIHAYQGGDPVSVAVLDPWSNMLCAVELH
ncbi:MAG: SH3 domain-containing protein [Clostridia bacterium]|nr:SH3 domain-containing protein [Clostridia bacterium]